MSLLRKLTKPKMFILSKFFISCNSSVFGVGLVLLEKEN